METTYILGRLCPGKIPVLILQDAEWTPEINHFKSVQRIQIKLSKVPPTKLIDN